MTHHELQLHVLPTPAAMGAAAGTHAARVLRETLAERGTARLMLAAAPSQSDTLRALAAAPGLDFSRVEVFHMDDYLELPGDAPQGFANWLEQHFLALLPTGAAPVFHRIGTSLAPADAAEGYAATMGDAPFDLTLCGLGVNGHLAFNDPPADLADPRPVRVVELDRVSRQQQVDEGHFARLDDVPARALTVTIPRLLHATHVVASVPGAQKRTAVTRTLAEAPHGDMPGTALKTHPRAHLYVDAAAAPTAGSSAPHATPAAGRA